MKWPVCILVLLIVLSGLIVKAVAVESGLKPDSTAIPETKTLSIKGSQTITVKSRTLEGSKEGGSAGNTFSREENLRLNISGRAADTDIDATLIRTSAIGVTQLGDKDEKISILLRRASAEAYLGDFTSDLSETEFTKLNKPLSGAKIKGDYKSWGFTALYSSPKGETKYIRQYGDNTQGPFKLNFSPVVIDSERVYVDAGQQKRGEDYNIDYQAGTITFIKKAIDAKSILQVYYDYRQTVYQHATYGLRAYAKPLPGTKIGVSYLDDSDSLQGARDIRDSMTQEAVEPRSHYVAGLDAALISENLSVDGELACSSKNLNLLSSSSVQETGKALKANLSADYGPFAVTASAKRISSDFAPIADPSPKQGQTEYTYGLSYGPSPNFRALADTAYSKYTQSGVVYENQYKTAKAQFMPENMAPIEYNYSEKDESNDPVTGDRISRIINRNSLETNYQFGILSATCKGIIEKWINRSPSEEATEYKKINFGIATIGLEKFTFTSNVELENRREPTGLEPYRHTYNLNLSAAPSKNYFISSAFQIIDDSAKGQTNVADLACRMQPFESIRAEGKYSINSLAEDFQATSEPVSKQTGSFSLDLRPWRAFNARYLYKPNFTRILRTQTLSYNNEQQQIEINVVPAAQALAGLIYKFGNSSNIYKQDYPNYRINEKTERTDSCLYTIKMAPLPMLSTEFNYLLENSLTNTLAATGEPNTYNAARQVARKFDAVFRTSLSEKFSIDSRYTYQKIDQGSADAASNIADTKSHTGSLKGTWNLSDMLSLSISGAFTKTNNAILSNMAYTVSGGLGIIYRRGDRLRIDFDAAHAKSYAGVESEKTNYSLKTKYGVSDAVNIIIQAAQETSRSPDYRLTEMTANIEINL